MSFSSNHSFNLSYISVKFSKNKITGIDFSNNKLALTQKFNVALGLLKSVIKAGRTAINNPEDYVMELSKLKAKVVAQKVEEWLFSLGVTQKLTDEGIKSLDEALI